uniref:Uncharacterized protein n=1 Tax=Anguilla anguilla TaxID=7936 RepID=A0A0E9RX36_ANGAN
MIIFFTVSFKKQSYADTAFRSACVIPARYWISSSFKQLAFLNYVSSGKKNPKKNKLFSHP